MIRRHCHGHQHQDSSTCITPPVVTTLVANMLARSSCSCSRNARSSCTSRDCHAKTRHRSCGARDLRKRRALAQPCAQSLNRPCLVLLSEGQLPQLQPSRSRVTFAASPQTTTGEQVWASTCARLGLFCGSGCKQASINRVKSSSMKSLSLKSCGGGDKMNGDSVVILGVP
jgi:hypothetical protein